MNDTPNARSVGSSPALLRAAALVAVVIGAAGSFGFMMHVGHGNRSYLLVTLFTIWDLAPFAALALAIMVSKHWSLLTETTLYMVSLVVAIGSLVLYGDVALGPPRPTPAFRFLAVPLGSWVVMAILVPFAGWMSRRNDQ